MADIEVRMRSLALELVTLSEQIERDANALTEAAQVLDFLAEEGPARKERARQMMRRAAALAKEARARG